MLLGCLRDAPEYGRNARSCKTERRTYVERIGGSIERFGIDSDFYGKASLMAGVIAAIAGAPIRSVVGRRAEVEKFESVGVMVCIEQIGEVARCGVGTRRRGHAEYEQAVESGGEGGCRYGNPQCHARSHCCVEVDHPFHPRVDCKRVRTHTGLRRSGIWSHGERLWDGPAADRNRRLTARHHHCDPGIGHQPCRGCTTPCGILPIIDNRGGWKRRRYGKWLVDRHWRGGALLRIGWFQHTRDPCGTRITEAVRELAPCRLLGLEIVARPPSLLPVVFSPVELLRRQLRFVRIE